MPCLADAVEADAVAVVAAVAAARAARAVRAVRASRAVRAVRAVRAARGDMVGGTERAAVRAAKSYAAAAVATLGGGTDRG